MKFAPYLLNATAVDGTGSLLAFVPAADNKDMLPAATGDYVDRASGLPPALAGVKIQAQTITLNVFCKSTNVQDDHETLKTLLAASTDENKKFKVKDKDASDRVWYVEYRRGTMGDVNGRNVKITLLLDYPVWLTDTATTESDWTISVSGSTKVVNINEGHEDAYPTFEFVPGSVWAGAANTYRAFPKIVNPTLRTAANYKLDVSGFVTPSTGGLDTRLAASAGGLIADDSNKCEVNNGAGIDASQTTIPYDTVTGSIPSYGMGYCGTEQISWTGKTGTTSGNLTGCTRGISTTTAATHADNAVIYVSRIQVDCRDVIVQMSGGNGDWTTVPRTIMPLNNQYSRIWVSMDIAPRTTGKLTAALDDNDTGFALGGLESVPLIDLADGYLFIDDEVIAYAQNDVATPIQISGGTLTFPAGTCYRGALDTTAASHSDNATAYFIPGVRILSGRIDAALPAADPERPVFNTSTSTNAQHIYADFNDSTIAGGACQWAAINQMLDAGAYSTFNVALDWYNRAPANPAAVLGATALTQGTCFWQLYNPFGMTSIVWGTPKVRNLPAFTAYTMSRQTGGWTYTAVTASAAFDDTVTTLSDITTTPSVGAAAYYARLSISNLTGRMFARLAGVQVADATVNLSALTTSDTEGVPVVTAGTRTAIEYNMVGKLKNDTTGEWLTVDADVAIGQTITINTLTKRVNYSLDGSNQYAAITGWSGVRNTWLRAQQGNNTFSWTGSPNMVCVVKWQGRNN